MLHPPSVVVPPSMRVCPDIVSFASRRSVEGESSTGRSSTCERQNSSRRRARPFDHVAEVRRELEHLRLRRVGNGEAFAHRGRHTGRIDVEDLRLAVVVIDANVDARAERHRRRIRVRARRGVDDLRGDARFAHRREAQLRAEAGAERAVDEAVVVLAQRIRIDVGGDARSRDARLVVLALRGFPTRVAQRHRDEEDASVDVRLPRAAQNLHRARAHRILERRRETILKRRNAEIAVGPV